MKTLILARHAKSSWNTDAQTDFQRPLNKRGLRDAQVMAQRLSSKGPIPEKIVTSTAHRALATAELYLQGLGLREDQLLKTSSIYEAPVNALFEQMIALPEHCSVAMLVGHNPGMSAACTSLCERAQLQMPTSAMACFDLDIDNWSLTYRDCATLRWFDYPKNQEK